MLKILTECKVHLVAATVALKLTQCKCLHPLKCETSFLHHRFS